MITTTADRCVAFVIEQLRMLLARGNAEESLTAQAQLRRSGGAVAAEAAAVTLRRCQLQRIVRLGG